MDDRLLQVRGLIDLDVLAAERRGDLKPPPCRKASETARNDAAAKEFYLNPKDYPEVVPSVEEHLLAKGYTKNAVSEALLDIAKHADEKDKPGPDLTYFSEWEKVVGLCRASMRLTADVEPSSLDIDELRRVMDTIREELAAVTQDDAVAPRITAKQQSSSSAPLLDTVVAWHGDVKMDVWKPIRSISGGRRPGLYPGELIIDDDNDYWRWSENLKSRYGGYWTKQSKLELLRVGPIRPGAKPPSMEAKPCTDPFLIHHAPGCDCRSCAKHD
jgi:hypothetical protein